jgi:hypothetical protein
MWATSVVWVRLVDPVLGCGRQRLAVVGWVGAAGRCLDGLLYVWSLMVAAIRIRGRVLLPITGAADHIAASVPDLVGPARHPTGRADPRLQHTWSPPSRHASEQRRVGSRALARRRGGLGAGAQRLGVHRGAGGVWGRAPRSAVWVGTCRWGCGVWIVWAASALGDHVLVGCARLGQGGLDSNRLAASWARTVQAGVISSAVSGGRAGPGRVDRHAWVGCGLVGDVAGLEQAHGCVGVGAGLEILSGVVWGASSGSGLVVGGGRRLGLGAGAGLRGRRSLGSQHRPAPRTALRPGGHCRL